MKVRIQSDGTPQGTNVFTEDGAEVRGLTGLTWTIETADVARVHARFAVAGLESAPAELLISEAHLRELAGARGFELVARTSDA